MRHLLCMSASLSAFVAVLAIPTVAAAQPRNPNCPPGSWFCEEAPPQPPPAAQPLPSAQPLQPLPPAQEYAPPPQGQPQQPPVYYHPYHPNPPPVVIYQPPPPVMIVRQERPVPYTWRRPTNTGLVQRNEWGLNLHLEGAMIGRGQSDASMGGVGFGLRYKPIPHFGVEADLDFVTGTDYNGFHRSESAFTVNGMIFLNPRNKAQVYLLGGFGWSGARATDETSGAYNRDLTYSYFGGQAGVGLELRLSRHFALNADVRAFIRGRIDNDAQRNPEFTDGRRTTNTSGGGLLTAGMTFYF